MKANERRRKSKQENNHNIREGKESLGKKKTKRKIAVEEMRKEKINEKEEKNKEGDEIKGKEGKNNGKEERIMQKGGY